MKKTIVKTEGLHFSYEKETAVLKNVSMEITAGENVGLIGANGVGKSTLMKILVGLCSGYTGNVFVSGMPVEAKTIDDIRKNIGYVFQDADNQLFMANVYEDVAFAPRNYGYDEAEVEKRVARALKSVQMTHLKDKPIYKLSGGEKKLASIATVLSMEPELLLMDEPSVALDPKRRRQLISILNDLPTAKLISGHDLDFIMDTCERTILLWEGEIAFDGKTEEIMRNQELLEKHGLELPLRFQRYER